MSQPPCPHCGTLNRASARFCKDCQTPLGSSSQVKTCPQCQTANPVDAKSCANCRYDFNPVFRLITSQLGRLQVAWRGVGGIGASFAVVCILGMCTLCTLLVFFVAMGEEGVAEATPTLAAAEIVASIADITPSPEPPDVPSPSPTAIPSPVSPACPAINTPTPFAGTPSSADLLDRAKRGTVLVVVPRESSEGYYSTGTGSVITKRGYILTANHLFLDDRGRPYDASGEITIWFPPRSNLKADAEFRYRAVLVAKDAGKDLALLKIVAQRDGAPLPVDLELGVIPIGDSDMVDSPDPITILGYPGVGKVTSLTLSTGTVAGFLQVEGYIKTTGAEISGGNSGGPALNSAYEQIGIVTKVSLSDNTQKIPGKIGLLRPINLARSLIELAKRECGE